MQTDQMALEETLVSHVQAILGEGGLITRVKGMSHNAQQLNYAINAVKGMARQDRPNARTSINAIQAATGTGKTVGYLVPAMLYAALTGERAVISTYTRHLQAQVLNDAELVGGWVRELTGNILKTRLRIGASNFLSAGRIEQLQSAMLREGNKEASVAFLEDLLEWTCAVDELGNPTHSGMLNDYLAETGLDALPFGILSSWVGIKADSPLAERQAYVQHVADAEDADVMVLNHALLISSALRWGGTLTNSKHALGVVVCDEADRLRDAAESMTQADVTFMHTRTNAKAVADRLELPDLYLAASKMTDSIQAMRAPADRVMILDKHQSSTADVMSLIEGYVSKAMPVAKRLSDHMQKDDLFHTGIPEDVASDFIGYTDRLSEIVRLSKDGEALAMISWSPVRAFPSIRMGRAQPGKILGRLWAQIKDAEYEKPSVLVPAILFTSATLGTPGRGLPMAFDEFFNDIGVIRHARKGEDRPIHHVHTDLFAQFEPMKFGDLSFVVMSPMVQDPALIENDIAVSSPEWLDACAEMIALASAEEGRTMVLTTSYADAESLGAILKSHELSENLIIHERGQTLAQAVSLFRANPKSVLLTPAAWEGLNLPGLIKQLVITRIPYSSTDSTELMLRKLGYLKSGLAENKANSLINSRMISDARRKLGQGIGRPIRSASDSAKIWFADPRMPTPAALADSLHPIMLSAPARRQNLSLLSAIPARFRHTRYDNAPMFVPSGWTEKPMLVSSSM